TPGLKLVAIYEQRRDWKNAKSLANELGANFPRNLDVLTVQGRVQLAAGDAVMALSTYKRAYQLAPDAPSILSRYVVLLKRMKYFRDAWDVLQQAVTQDPSNAALKADLIRVDAEVDGVDQAGLRVQEYARKDP